MVAWRLPDDAGLWIHSAVNLDPPTLQALEDEGRPAMLVVPNRFHRADAEAWKQRYPEIQVLAPAAARSAVESVLSVNALAEDVLPSVGVECIGPPGVGAFEWVYKLPLDEGHALVVTDLLFNLREHLPGIGGLFTRYVTRSTGFFGMTGVGRLFGLKDATAFAGWLRDQADDPQLRAVLVAHGDPILDHPAERLREAAQRLHPVR